MRHFVHNHRRNKPEALSRVTHRWGTLHGSCPDIIHNHHRDKPEARSHMRHRWGTHQANSIHNYHEDKPEALSRMRHRWGTHQGSCPGPQQPPTAPQTSPSAHHHGTLPVYLHICNRTTCQSHRCCEWYGLGFWDIRNLMRGGLWAGSARNLPDLETTAFMFKWHTPE